MFAMIIISWAVRINHKVGRTLILSVNVVYKK